jgi:hypothetical protein
MPRRTCISKQRQRSAFMRERVAHAREPEGRQNVYWATKEQGRRSWDSVAVCFCGCWACPFQSSFCSHCSGITDTGVAKEQKSDTRPCGEPPFPRSTPVRLLASPRHPVAARNCERPKLRTLHARPLVVMISHRLGKTEAAARLRQAWPRRDCARPCADDGAGGTDRRSAAFSRQRLGPGRQRNDSTRG